MNVLTINICKFASNFILSFVHIFVFKFVLKPILKLPQFWIILYMEILAQIIECIRNEILWLHGVKKKWPWKKRPREKKAFFCVKYPAEYALKLKGLRVGTRSFKKHWQFV